MGKLSARGERLVYAALGVGLAVYAGTRGIDGALLTLAGMLIGYAVGKKA